MRVKADLESKSLSGKRTRKMKRLFPEAFREGRLDFDILRKILGMDIETDKECYRLTWAGKKDCFNIIQDPPKTTLSPSIEESIDFYNTENIFIEGDNLEALKILQRDYCEKIKMIYIDPPYNTGNDFVYKDDFKDSLQNYLVITGQARGKKNQPEANRETSGRFHSNWLNMIYPRIFLSRKLLRKDGLIFISIDDNEIYNLRILMNEIFGEENFLAQIVRQTIKGGTGPSSKIRTNHDYIVSYAKDIDACTITGSEVNPEPLDKIDEKGPYRIGRELNKWGADSKREDVPSMFFPIPGPGGQDIFPIRNDGSEGRWRWGREKLLKAIEAGEVVFKKRDNGTYIVYEKVRSRTPRRKAYATFMRDIGTNARGTEDLKELFDGTCPIDFPKPVSMIRRLMEIAGVDSDDIVLDFFAGSGSTAQAVLEFNRDDGKNRKFILVQLPELTGNPEFPTISEICKERIRRSIRKIQREKSDKLDKRETSGFKVFHLKRKE